jgi:DNA-binding NarL/FixJ family response regulator
MDSRINRPTSGREAARASGRKRRFEKKRIRVAIADDDPMILDQIHKLLEPRFDVVGRARGGRELFQAVQKLLPAVIVADVTMSEMSGIEAARCITKNFPGVKVVMLSVHDDCAIVDAAFEAGASAYVSKFAAHTELIPAIEDALAGRLRRPSGLK